MCLSRWCDSPRLLMVLDLGSKRHGLVLLSQYAFSLDASPLTVSSNWPLCPRRCSLCGPGVDNVRAHPVQERLESLRQSSSHSCRTSEWPVVSLNIRTSALRGLAAASCVFVLQPPEYDATGYPCKSPLWSTYSAKPAALIASPVTFL